METERGSIERKIREAGQWIAYHNTEAARHGRERQDLLESLARLDMKEATDKAKEAAK